MHHQNMTRMQMAMPFSHKGGLLEKHSCKTPQVPVHHTPAWDPALSSGQSQHSTGWDAKFWLEPKNLELALQFYFWKLQSSSVLLCETGECCSCMVSLSLLAFKGPSDINRIRKWTNTLGKSRWNTCNVPLNIHCCALLEDTACPLCAGISTKGSNPGSSTL